MKKTKFNIYGMSCSACSAAVQRAMDKLEGVKHADVNLLTNSMLAEFDETVINENDIISAIQKAGYNASIDVKTSTEKQQKDLNTKANKIFIRLILSAVFLGALMFVSMGHMIGINIIPAGNNLLKGIVELILLCPILILNHKYFISGFKSILKLNPNMDSLIAVGASASIIYSLWQLISGTSSHYYFESAGMILTFITIGKFLESKSKAKTTGALTKLMDLSPKTSVVIRNGVETTIDSKDIVKGDIVVVKSGMHFPADGVVLEGFGTVDESAITGESMPVSKRPDSKVTGGTTLNTGYIKFRAEQVGEETTLSEIIRLVEDATLSKPKIAKTADKISRIFVPSVITIALITTLVWYILTNDFETALNFGISVLVISCPCALGLATPTAIMVGTGKAAELGVLVKSAEAFESGSKIQYVMLDKTGTITVGRPQVTDFTAEDDNTEELKKICAKIESMSEHPLAEAIVNFSNSFNNITVTEFSSEHSKGVSGKVNGEIYAIGKKSYVTDEALSHKMKLQEEKLSKEGKTIIYVSKNKTVVAVIGIADTIKDTSVEGIQLLSQANMQTIMLTGDNRTTAEHIKNAVGIDKAYSELMPADKNRIIKEHQEIAPTAMVGDGINDSPALAVADVGIALGAGTDIARESADIVLIRNDLRDVHTALHICRKVIKNIKENLFWALMYNTICIPIAAGALYYPLGLKLSPMIGTIAMSLSSICVISNALRLKRIKRNFETNERKDEIKMKTIIIEGMACPHCQARVTDILKPFDENVTVDHTKGTAIIADNVDNETIKSIIEDAGYKVINIE